MNEIFVVKTNNIDKATYNRLLTFLPDDEKERIEFKRNNTSSLTGAILLRYALMKVFNLPLEKVEILRSQNGKPYLKGYDNIHFSISHNNDVVVCVVSDKPIGIDVQEIKPVSEGVIKRTCSEKEIGEILNSSDPVSSFICTFTKKEAILKKKGTGILDMNIKNCLSSEDAHSIKFENYWISYTL